MRLVAAPTLSFEELDETLSGLGWFLESESQTPPLIPGEPELCVYTHRQAGARITYTFNPVVNLKVLAFDGRDAAAQRALVAGRVPVLDGAAIRRLQASEDREEALLGRLAGEVLGDEQRVIAAVEVLAAEKRATPDRSVLFPRLGDEEMRRQVLRWLMHDNRARSPHIEWSNLDEVIRSGLADPDEEVRRTAELAAEHFTSPRTARPLRDDASLMAHALTTPLEQAPWPTRLPAGIEKTELGFRLVRSGAALCWVGPVAHWLGSGESIRRVTPAGFLIACEPVSSALATWALAPSQGPIGAAGARAAQAHLCGLDEAQRIAAALARIEGAPVRLATGDEWEMAARGPDGRLYPWGSFAMPDWAERLSPWGCAQMVGHELEWTADGELRGGAGPAPCARQTPAVPDTRAAVRLVVARPAGGGLA